LTTLPGEPEPAGSLWSRRPSEFVLRIGFNGVAQAAPLLATVAVTPLLIHRLGEDRFGIWSLVLVALSTLTTLDGGVSASLARYFAFHAAHEDRAETGRLLLGSTLVFAALGVVLTAVAIPAAPLFVDLLKIPMHLHTEATLVFRWLPLILALALVSDATASLLQGNGRFAALAATMVVSAAAFVAAIFYLTGPTTSLGRVVLALGIRYGVAAGVGLALASDQVSLSRPWLPDRSYVRDVARYASRMQVTSLAVFVNGELNSLVVAVVLPIRYVGVYGIGMQAASAARTLPLFAFPPALARLTTSFRLFGRQAASADFGRLDRRWLASVTVYGGAATTAIVFSVPVWLGHGYLVSGVVAAILLVAYTLHVALTGMRTCYVRAIGRPGLETRYSILWTISNALLLLPFAFVGGVIGVATATALSAALASLYFVRLCLREEGLPGAPVRFQLLGLTGLAAALTLVGEVGVRRLHVSGFPGLFATGGPPLAALAATWSVGNGVRRRRKSQRSR
jgi:O-antigen/teichoic acid export membrane protein